ncbi:hypothetical protein [Streptomyces fradiae]|uniref:hypothetical protein n=1 Tax=Streptomyces fradiae TaxID=1906 RepID=UPI0039861D18
MPVRDAAVLAAALSSWSTSTAPHKPPTAGTARLEIRQGPEWSHTGRLTLDHDQVVRLLALLRADLVPPAPLTPAAAAAAVDRLLTEWRAEGRRTIRPADLVAALPRIGQSRTWLAAHLVRLVDTGYLRETRRPGVYQLR